MERKLASGNPFGCIAEQPAVYVGPVFHRPFSAIINSHQPLYSSSISIPSWVRSTIGAVESILSDDLVHIGSFGLSSYELSLWYAGRMGAKQIVVAPVPGHDRIDETVAGCLSDFDLDESHTGFLCFISKETPSKSPERDRLILDFADRIYPVSVRKTGRMRSLLDALPESRIDRQFQIPFEPPGIRPVQCTVDNPEALELDGGYLTHWTRRFKGPFPGEKLADYYRSLISMNGISGCSAFHALHRILETGRIYSTSAKIRGKHQVVSFTSLAPHQMVNLMTWNRSHVRFSFEPFGIAVRKSAMRKIGARPVIYGEKSVYDRLKASDQPFYQYQGKGGKWRREREWRITGHFHLRDMAPDDIRILVPGRNYKELLENEIKAYKVLNLQNDN